jgi:hypothetical protein
LLVPCLRIKIHTKYFLLLTRRSFYFSIVAAKNIKKYVVS